MQLTQAQRRALTRLEQESLTMTRRGFGKTQFVERGTALVLAANGLARILALGKRTRILMITVDGEKELHREVRRRRRRAPVPCDDPDC